MGVHCMIALMVYGWIVECSGHLALKHVHLFPLPSRLIQFHLEEKWGTDVQTRRDVSRTVEDRG